MSTVTNDAATAAAPALPPHALVIQMAGGHIVAQGIFALAELGIADHLEDGPRSAAALAADTATDVPTASPVSVVEAKPV